MGIISMGVPQEITLELAELNETSVFIETGTYEGNTARWASDHFPIVHTIEKSRALYESCSRDLSALRGVVAHLGDSRHVLPRILELIDDEKAVWWLDSHWSGGITAGIEDECPLLDELQCLVDRIDDIVLIDDARLFLSAPPVPHDPSQWPTIVDIVDVLQLYDKKRLLQVVNDVVWIVPNQESLRKRLVEYAQVQSDIV